MVPLQGSSNVLPYNLDILTLYDRDAYEQMLNVKEAEIHFALFWSFHELKND